MKRSSPKATRGVALVITLIMLSVVTIVAVAFLAVARRERASVGAASEQTDARFIAEAALARAQADIASRLAASGNRADFAPFVSTNYTRPAGFDPANAPAAPFLEYSVNPFNVSYTNTSGRALRFDDPTVRDQYRSMLANLLYDPRPPVFVTTNAIRGAALDFRYYLDLNRNGFFEPPLNETRVVGTIGSASIIQTNHVPGDLQWIGVLEHPQLPHSATNRFIGRIAYLVLPTGLDFNYIHNRAKNLGAGESFLRNQGLGSWEMNLAALLNRTDAGIWSNYLFNTTVGGSSSGVSFLDANAVVRYRLGSGSLESANVFLQPADFHPDSRPDAPFRNTFLDLYANGPIVRSTTLPLPTDNNENRDLPWDGSDTISQFRSFQDLFAISGPMSTRLRGAVPRPGARLTNDWTLYRMLYNIGTDSPDGRFYTAYDANRGYYRRAKLNLNFAHGDDGEVQVRSTAKAAPAAAGVGTFRPWEPLEFFTNAVDRLLETGLHFQGVTFHADRIPVRYFGVSVITNQAPYRQRVSWVTNQITYGPDIHRLLQMAANILDASQNRSNQTANLRDLPTTFRPRFAYVPEQFNLDSGTRIITTNLYIVGWQEVTNASPLSYRWVDPDDVFQLRTLTTNPAVALQPTYDVSTDVNVHGVPWVIGARKGFPSFNEAFWQTQVGVTRRVKLTKSFPDARYATNLVGGRPVAGTFFTNVQYLVDIKRRGSVEAWNSYAADYKRPYRLVVSNLFCLGVSNYVDGQYRSLIANIPENQRLLRFMVTNDQPNTSITKPWPGSKEAGGSSTSFQVPIDFASVNRGLTNHLVFVPPGALGGSAAAASGQLLDLAYPANRRFELAYYPAVFSNSTPNLAVAMTNYLFYAMIDDATGRILDFVNLKSISLETNILNWMAVTNVGDNFVGFATRRPTEPFNDGHLWMTNVISPNAPGITAGITNQVLASAIDQGNVTADIYRPYDQTTQDKIRAVARFRYFLYRIESDWVAAGGTYNDRTNLTADAIAPTRQFILTDRRSVNDPLVHYTLQDLRPGALWVVNRGAGKIPGLQTNFFGVNLRVPMIQRRPKTYAPWGQAPIYSGASSSGTYVADARFKDPGITQSDDWDFPAHLLPTVGWLGRVHRGTPWQTVYLKAGVPALGENTSVMPSGDATWAPWAGYRANQSYNFGLPAVLSTNLNATTEPHGDWNLVHLFTTAYNDNAARGLLPVNASGDGAWAAVLGGVNVLRPNGADTFIDPVTEEFGAIVTNINFTRLTTQVRGAFTNLGGILAAPGLSVGSPYLNGWQSNVRTNTDAIVERIPQQILSLLRQPEPHFVVYAFGQALKPAPGSLVTAPGPYFGLCQNYQVAGEYVTKTVLRFDGAATNLQAVVERQYVMPAQ